MASIAHLIRGTDRVYFDLYEQAGANVARAGALLDEMLAGFPETLATAQDIRGCERDGDQITHDLIRRLNETFVIDPVIVIRWKDILERLEHAIDSTERVADILDGIVIKHA